MISAKATRKARLQMMDSLRDSRTRWLVAELKSGMCQFRLICVSFCLLHLFYFTFLVYYLMRHLCDKYVTKLQIFIVILTVVSF